MMEDAAIVGLYWQRDTRAIEETARKYGAYCRAIAQRICPSREDGEECVNDTWLSAWNAMPDKRPDRLSPFLGRIVRNHALHRVEAAGRHKRGSGETDLTRLTGRQAVEARPKVGLLRFEEFFATPEYRMAAAFQHVFGDWTDAQHVGDRDFWTPGQYVREWHYLPFPTGVEALDVQLAAGLEEYGLRIPTDAEAVCFGDKVDPTLMLSLASHRDPAPVPAEKDAAESLLDIAGLVRDGAVESVCRWDNGAWQALVSFGSSSYELVYVPKGVFCPVVGEALHTDAESWAYDSACGEQLMLTLGGETAYPRFPTAMALYETDQAYALLKAQGVTDAAVLQDFCDNTDFTALP